MFLSCLGLGCGLPAEGWGVLTPLFLPAEGQGCTAYDVAVNSDFYRRMQNSDFLRELVITIAREGLEDKYNLQLNPEWRMMKNRPFMGSISQQNIRSEQRPRIQELGDLYTPAPERAESGPEKPHLNLWLEAPDLLLAEIDLPKLDGALGLSLEIGENRLVMGGPQQLYHLDAYIPLQINSHESKAAFHRKRKVPGGGAWGSRDIGGGLDSVSQGGGLGAGLLGPGSSFSLLCLLSN
nr:PIH1 domain-containing protein 1 isoform X3 [Gorilla gorilla gorilla]